MRAAWPATGPVDEKLVRSSEYLMDAAHDFRIRYKQYMTPKGKVCSRFLWDIFGSSLWVQIVLVLAQGVQYIVTLFSVAESSETRKTKSWNNMDSKNVSSLAEHRSHYTQEPVPGEDLDLRTMVFTRFSFIRYTHIYLSCRATAVLFPIIKSFREKWGKKNSSKST